MKTIILLKNYTITVNSQPVTLPFTNLDINIKKISEFYASFEGSF